MSGDIEEGRLCKLTARAVPSAQSEKVLHGWSWNRYPSRVLIIPLHTELRHHDGVLRDKVESMAAFKVSPDSRLLVVGFIDSQALPPLEHSY